jgi:glutathione reductase (NADPH)
MVREYDLIVIGSGVAGGEVARTCRSEGRRVAIVESGPFGGTCPLRGCNPKKVLTGTAGSAARSNSLEGKGIRTKTDIAWPDLMRFKRSFTEPIPKKVQESLSKTGIDTFQGTARFTGERTVEADGQGLRGTHLFIATGAVPRPLDVPGEEHIITSDRFLELDSLPRRIVFVGGGYVSFEFAHVAARAGAQVTILHRSEQVLKGFDPDLVKMLLECSREAGIQVHTDSPLHAVEQKNEQMELHSGPEGSSTLTADLIVHGAGRVPAVQDLNLDAAGVSHTDKGISVNSYMQSTSNPAVYAAGDVAATLPPLTPTASLEAGAAAQNILHGNKTPVDHTGIPSVVFTYPPLARVGMLEQELRDQGMDHEQHFEDTASWFSSRRIGLTHAGIKVLFSKEDTKILGAHIMGNHAEEVINVFALAVRLNLTGDDLKQAVWSYPSSIYEIQKILP